ncbi:carboxymuconolactone decarboxylase family protein [Marinobacter halodurans]|uniref:Carboxymuconolactone decarboxylase family protein n=1 Tax=Marinobacter halodurans TaxID=2528979 RepID=A0ABY1ZLH0_9GAMM|nr:carboxymuconolactone decarboxylase family protein [Marinobacter halodurans]TBW55166.1 carboxymuconolactone decarboxylase family protein [Marinobacter halodurans]
MQSRLNPFTAAPEAIDAMVGLERYLHDCGLEYALVELVRIRASQINGCGYCLHMHTRDAREAGETEERLHVLAAWRDSPLFSDRERAALAWTESLTRIADTGAPDADFEQARAQFTEEELVKLTLLIGAINTWNRIAVGFRRVHATGGARTPKASVRTKATA